VNFWKTAGDAQSAIIGVYDRVAKPKSDLGLLDVGTDATTAPEPMMIMV